MKFAIERDDLTELINMVVDAVDKSKLGPVRFAHLIQQATGCPIYNEAALSTVNHLIVSLVPHGEQAVRHIAPQPPKEKWQQGAEDEENET